MAVEQIEFPEQVNDNALQGFHDDAQRGQDLYEAMQGQAHMDGGQHDLDPRGITSQDFAQEEQVLVDASEFQRAQYPQPQAAQFVQNQSYSEAPGLPDPNGQDFQRLYGRSENEKGELRRALQAQTEAYNSLLMQMQSGQNGGVGYAPQFSGYAQAQPQYQAPQYNQAVQYNQPAPRLVQKDPGEMLVAEDLDTAFQNGVVPYFAAMEQRVNQLQGVIQQQQMQAFNAQKVQLGLTPQIEFQLVAENPWLRSINDPGAYLQSVRSLMQNRQSTALLQRQHPVQNAQNGTQINPAIAAAQRRVTYVERGVASVPQNGGGVTPQQRFSQAWAATMQIPIEGGKRGEAQRNLLKAAGTKEVSGFRDLSVMTR